MSGIGAIPIVLAIGAASTLGQAGSPQPHIGYLYPAGGNQGTTFQVVVGGQLLRGVGNAYISGSGVYASVIRHYPPLNNLSPEQREALTLKLRILLENRWSEMARDGQVGESPPWEQLAALGFNFRRMDQNGETSSEEMVALPEHPLFENLDDKSFRELLHILCELRSLRMGPRNTPIAESVLLEVAIDREAPPGERELRLVTPQGLTNPMCFQVGVVPEVSELETGDGRIAEQLPREPALELPAVLNGRILAGDVDRFRFRADRGQRLVFEVYARRLNPFLADAVPGWFQATLALYNGAGKELAFVDDYRFSPDPVLMYEVPEDGEYTLQVRDSIYRGREDFVYRIHIGERPFISSTFPLGCRAGRDRFVSIDGWNLSAKRLFLEAPSDAPPGIRQKRYGHGKTMTNAIAYDVGVLPAADETEDNDTIAEAQRIRPPRMVDGHIGRPGDVDVFKFKGRAGEEIVAEVIARRLGSPLDSLLRLKDSTGTVLAWNDDCEHKDGYLYTDLGSFTHHADSYLRAPIPENGDYYVEVSDAQSKGGDAYTYRLRVGPPQGDFELCVTPSSVNMRAGFAVPVRVYAQRKDGFEGRIELVLKDPAAGFSLAGAEIPAGRNSVRATLSAAPQVKGPVVLALEGRATIDHKVVARPVVPADDMMQAFLYRHLVPAQELMVAITGGRRFGRSLEWKGDARVRIPAGGRVSLQLAAPPHPKARELQLELNDPPPGITIQKVTAAEGEFTLELAANRSTAQVGLMDNLIFEGFIEVERGGQEGQPAKQKQRVPVGFLPALPVEIVKE
jgi:hypothetical protein